MTPWLFLAPLGAFRARVRGERVALRADKCLAAGDSCNSITFTASNHIGTHYDFPSHFDQNGKTLLDFGAEWFTHERVALFWLELGANELVSPAHLERATTEDVDVTLVLLRTGASRYRGEERFWKAGPGLGRGLASDLRERYPNLKAVGVDSISIAAFQQRELGREVHREFLNQGSRSLLLIEDMNLEPLHGETPSAVVALPLRIEGADGAPCTVIAKLGPKEVALA